MLIIGLLLLIAIALGAINILASRKLYYAMTFAIDIPLLRGLPNGLPVIALRNNGQWLYFLVDTGSNISMIAEAHRDKIKVENESSDELYSTTGIGGTIYYSKQCLVDFEDERGDHYRVKMSISPQINNVTTTIKGATNIDLSGLIGTDFLRAYKYIIDFDSLTLRRKLT